MFAGGGALKCGHKYYIFPTLIVLCKREEVDLEDSENICRLYPKTIHGSKIERFEKAKGRHR